MDVIVGRGKGEKLGQLRSLRTEPDDDHESTGVETDRKETRPHRFVVAYHKWFTNLCHLLSYPPGTNWCPGTTRGVRQGDTGHRRQASNQQSISGAVLSLPRGQCHVRHTSDHGSECFQSTLHHTTDVTKTDPVQILDISASIPPFHPIPPVLPLFAH